MLDLYAGIWHGQPLGGNDFVICADEKTSIQVRCRCHPTLPPGKARRRGSNTTTPAAGRWQYLAAWDVHRGQVNGRCEPTTGIEPFTRLVKQVMTAEPYASADRVFWITDNGSSHRGAGAVARMQTAWPNAHLVHLPVHASWPDQAEIYFSVVQRKVVSPNDFTDLGQIRHRLAAFETRYNAVAEPFNWRFTRTDLNQLLERIDGRESHPTPHSGGHIRSRASTVAEQQRRAAQRGDQPFGVEVGEEQQPVGAVAHEVAGAAADAEPDDRSNSRSCVTPTSISGPPITAPSLAAISS